MQIISQPLHGVPDLGDGGLVRVGLAVGRAALRGHVGQEVEQVVQVHGLGARAAGAREAAQLVRHALQLCSLLVLFFLETGIEVAGLGWNDEGNVTVVKQDYQNKYYMR